MDMEDRVRAIEKESGELSVIVKEWINETRTYRGRRERIDDEVFEKLDSLKTSVLQLPCEKRAERTKGLTAQLAWIWGILGVGGSALAYAFIGHIFGK